MGPKRCSRWSRKLEARQRLLLPRASFQAQNFEAAAHQVRMHERLESGHFPRVRRPFGEMKFSEPDHEMMLVGKSQQAESILLRSFDEAGEIHVRREIDLAG